MDPLHAGNSIIIVERIDCFMIDCALLVLANEPQMIQFIVRDLVLKDIVTYETKILDRFFVCSSRF